MKLPHKTLERKLFAGGYQRIIAVDEVGMGALAGPVVVCAAMFNKIFFQKTHKKLHRLRDSKLLSPKKRAEFQKALVKLPGLKYQISYCYPKTIDRLNIYQASRLAMRRAIKKLVFSSRYLVSSMNKKRMQNTRYKIRDTVVLVDGPHKIPGIALLQFPVVKGDRRVFTIACASIIAKVYRDKMMIKYAKCFPGYGLERHKGYGTRFHQVQLALLGISKIHRKSFAPVARLI